MSSGHRRDRSLSAPLARQRAADETVETFERLRDDGKIRRWGVSNVDVAAMEELKGSNCATDQVLYNLEEGGIEFDLLPLPTSGGSQWR